MQRMGPMNGGRMNGGPMNGGPMGDDATDMGQGR